MSRSAVNFFLDLGLLVSFAALVCTQLVLQFAFPSADEAYGWTLWGWTYAEWSRISFGFLAAFAIGVLVHVMLHWTWVCGFVTARIARRQGRPLQLSDGERTLLGVALLIGLLVVGGAVIGVAQLSVQPG